MIAPSFQFLPANPEQRTPQPPTARPDPAPAFFLLAAVGLDRTIQCLLDPARATTLKLFPLVPSLPHLDNLDLHSLQSAIFTSGLD